MKVMSAVALACVGATISCASASAMTPDQAVAFVQAQTSSAQMEASLAALSPSDRAYVLKYAISPAYTVYDQSSTVSNNRRAKRTARAATCPNWTHDFTAKSYSWLGLWQFTFHSKHEWTGCNNKVTVDNHQERGNGAIGWIYNGSSYGAQYGCIGCYMHGREVFGYFGFIKYAINDVADLQAQVHGDGGWWAWANITGP